MDPHHFFKSFIMQMQQRATEASMHPTLAAQAAATAAAVERSQQLQRYQSNSSLASTGSASMLAGCAMSSPVPSTTVPMARMSPYDRFAWPPSTYSTSAMAAAAATATANANASAAAAATAQQQYQMLLLQSALANYSASSSHQPQAAAAAVASSPAESYISNLLAAAAAAASAQQQHSGPQREVPHSGRAANRTSLTNNNFYLNDLIRNSQSLLPQAAAANAAAAAASSAANSHTSSSNGGGGSSSCIPPAGAPLASLFQVPQSNLPGDLSADARLQSTTNGSARSASACDRVPGGAISHSMAAEFLSNDFKRRKNRHHQSATDVNNPQAAAAAVSNNLIDSYTFYLQQIAQQHHHQQQQQQSSSSSASSKPSGGNPSGLRRSDSINGPLEREAAGSSSRIQQQRQFRANGNENKHTVRSSSSSTRRASAGCSKSPTGNSSNKDAGKRDTSRSSVSPINVDAIDTITQAQAQAHQQNPFIASQNKQTRFPLTTSDNRTNHQIDDTASSSDSIRDNHSASDEPAARNQSRDSSVCVDYEDHLQVGGGGGGGTGHHHMLGPHNLTGAAAAAAAFTAIVNTGNSRAGGRGRGQQIGRDYYNPTAVVGADDDDLLDRDAEDEEEIDEEDDRDQDMDDDDDGGRFEEKFCKWKDCPMNGQQFGSLRELVDHVECHCDSDKKTFSCYWHDCNRDQKPFKALYMLKVHMRRHTGWKPHRCNFELPNGSRCDKSYSRVENLKTHHRSHTGDRPYSCQFEGCDKAFSNASDRAKHQNRTHSKEKPYVCWAFPECQKAYTDPSSLRKHIKTVHGTDYYTETKRKRNASRRQNHSSSTSTGATTRGGNNNRSTLSQNPAEGSDTSNNATTPPSDQHPGWPLGTQSSNIEHHQLDGKQAPKRPSPYSTPNVATSVKSESSSSTVYAPAIGSSSKNVTSSNLSSPSESNSETNFYPYNPNAMGSTSSQAPTPSDYHGHHQAHLNHSNQSGSNGIDRSHQQQQQQQRHLTSPYHAANGMAEPGGTNNYMQAYPGVAGDYGCSVLPDNGRPYYLSPDGTSQQVAELARDEMLCYDKREAKCSPNMAAGSMTFDRDHSSTSPVKYPPPLRSDIYPYGNCANNNMNNNWPTSVDGAMLASQARHSLFNRHEDGQDYAQQANNFVHNNFHQQKQSNVQIELPTIKYDDYNANNLYRNPSCSTLFE